ncbi:MAG: hypothetical protein ACK55Z_13350, partial [bacterium]
LQLAILIRMDSIHSSYNIHIYQLVYNKVLFSKFRMRAGNGNSRLCRMEYSKENNLKVYNNRPIVRWSISFLEQS